MALSLILLFTIIGVVVQKVQAAFLLIAKMRAVCKQKFVESDMPRFYMKNYSPSSGTKTMFWRARKIRNELEIKPAMKEVIIKI